jgi:hypothetical protein
MIRIEDSLNELLSAGVISMETAKQFADDPRVIGQAQPQTPQGLEHGAKGSRRNLFGRKGG